MTPERLIERVEELSAEARLAEAKLPYWEMTAILFDDKCGFDLVFGQAATEEELSQIMDGPLAGDPRAQYLMRDWTGWDDVPGFIEDMASRPLSTRPWQADWSGEGRPVVSDSPLA